MFDEGYLLGGRYKILSLLGEGGMANVYLAEDIILQRKVAVKVLRLDLQKDPKTLARFDREARATSDLSHPNIVSILDVGEDHNRHYLVMEYVNGPDLEEYIPHKALGHQPCRVGRARYHRCAVRRHQRRRLLRPRGVPRDLRLSLAASRYGHYI